jgi:hypothetical protein
VILHILEVCVSRHLVNSFVYVRVGAHVNFKLGNTLRDIRDAGQKLFRHTEWRKLHRMNVVNFICPPSDVEIE